MVEGQENENENENEKVKGVVRFDENTRGDNDHEDLNAAESKCLGMLRADQPRERKLAGLLLLLHLLKKNKQAKTHKDDNTSLGLNSLADRAFRVLDEKFLVELAFDPRSLSLVVAVTQTLARLSSLSPPRSRSRQSPAHAQVASDPKLWRIAQTGLKTITQSNPTHLSSSSSSSFSSSVSLSLSSPPTTETEIESLTRKKEREDLRQWNEVAEDTLELALLSLQSSKVVEEGTPECPQYLRDTLDILLTCTNKEDDEDEDQSMHINDSEGPGVAAKGRGSVHSVRLMAIRLLSAGLARMSSARKGITILNLSESGRFKWKTSLHHNRTESSSLIFEDVVSILVKETLLDDDSRSRSIGECKEEEEDTKNKNNNKNKNKKDSLAPIEAIRALGHWLHPDYMINAQEATKEKWRRLSRLGLEVEEEEVEHSLTWNWLGDLQRGLCSAVKSSVHIQGDCVKIAASLSKALGMTWMLSHSSSSSSSSSSSFDQKDLKTFQKGEGFAYLILLTAKTEISLLLSDALQPDAKVSSSTATTMGYMMGADKNHEAMGVEDGCEDVNTHVMKAGDRATAHLGDCFVLTEQAIQLVSKVAERGQDDAVQDYFLVLHGLIGVVMDYMVEVSKQEDKNESENDAGLFLEEVNLAATRVLGHYFMEVPEFCVSDSRLPKIIDAMTSLVEDEDEVVSFGWTYLVPTLSQICGDKDCTWVLEVGQESLDNLLRLTCVLKEEVDPSLHNASLGKAVLLTNCLRILQEILAHKTRCRDLGAISLGATQLLQSILRWSEEMVFLLEEGCAMEWLELVLAICELSVFLLEKEKYFKEEEEGNMGEHKGFYPSSSSPSSSSYLLRCVDAARMQLEVVVKPLYGVFCRTLGEMAEEGRYFAEFLDDPSLQSQSSSSTLQDWCQMMDFLKYLLQVYLEFEDKRRK